MIIAILFMGISSFISGKKDKVVDISAPKINQDGAATVKELGKFFNELAKNGCGNYTINVGYDSNLGITSMGKYKSLDPECEDIYFDAKEF